jgi:hypothetical protein
MSRRHLLLVVSEIGLALSIWAARPANKSDIDGWLFALAWPSMAWWALLVLTLFTFRARWQFALLGALTIVAALEIVLLIYSIDPLMLAVKPIYQVPLAVVGGFVFFIIGRHHDQEV